MIAQSSGCARRKSRNSSKVLSLAGSTPVSAPRRCVEVARDLQSLAVAPVALRTLAAASMEGARCVWTDGVSEFGRDDKVFRIWQSGSPAKSTLIIALSPTDIRGGRASVPKQWDDLIRSVLTSSVSKVIESARTSRDRRTKHRPTRPAASIGFDLLNCLPCRGALRGRVGRSTACSTASMKTRR